MRLLLPLLCALCVTPARTIFEGTCPKKETQPHVLVVPLGSNVVLTCNGNVKVNGVKVSRTPQRRRGSSVAAPTAVSVTPNAEEQSNTSYTAGPTAVATVTSDAGYPTTGPQTAETTTEDDGADYEGGGRVTRAVKQSPCRWYWNGRPVDAGRRDWGQIGFLRGGATLSLAAVRDRASGNYSCHYRGVVGLFLKVVVADPPERPSLSCYKRSPSSRIRCEWTLQKPVKLRPSCLLFVSKTEKQIYLPSDCSYSPEKNRCWCQLNNGEEELRTLHMAYLCVTTIAGNATSEVLPFIPMSIVQPNPPSNVVVRAEEGHEKRLRVTWKLPNAWRSQDRYYKLIYQVKYHPRGSSPSQEQIKQVDEQLYSIGDAMPDVEYMIQVRAKDEYDGRWSSWSPAVNASSWTGRSHGKTATEEPSVFLPDDLDELISTHSEGSGSEEDTSNVLESVHSSVEAPLYILWICASFAVLSVVLAVYIFRHRRRFVPKLQKLSTITMCGDSSQSPPTGTTVPEVRALVTFAPPQYKERALSTEGEEEEEQNEEDRGATERTEAMHFNNTSYFLIPRE